VPYGAVAPYDITIASFWSIACFKIPPETPKRCHGDNYEALSSFVDKKNPLVGKNRVSHAYFNTVKKLWKGC